MKQDWWQQALAGLAVLFVIAVTLVGGVLLATADGPLVADGGRQPTATPYRLPTLPPADEGVEVEPETPETEAPPTVTTEATEAATATLAPTSTPQPTVTDIPTATAEPLATATPVRQPAATTCQIQSGWVPYIVDIGETLYSISRRHGVSVSTLQRGSCLGSTSLDAGQLIYVPPTSPAQPPAATAAPTSAPQPTTAPTSAPAVGGPISRPPSSGTDGACIDSGSVIMSPTVGSILRGEVAFYGSAVHPDLQLYKLEVRQEGASASQGFVTAYTGTSEVRSGLLGTVNTAAFPNGEYWVRLMVVDNTGNWPEPCSILYTFQN